MLVGVLCLACGVLLLWCSVLHTERRYMRLRERDIEQHLRYWMAYADNLRVENAELLSRVQPVPSTEPPAMAAALARAPTMFEEARRQEAILRAVHAKQSEPQP